MDARREKLDNSELRQTRTTIASAHDALCEVVKSLEAIAYEVSTQPVANEVFQAIDLLEVICTELRVAGPELDTSLDRSIEQEGLDRALSEVKSGEYDVQG